MHYLFVKHKVADFVKWKRVFDADAETQRKAGLHLLHVLREIQKLSMAIHRLKSYEMIGEDANRRKMRYPLQNF